MVLLKTLGFKKSIFFLNEKKVYRNKNQHQTNKRNCTIEIIGYSTLDRKTAVTAFVLKRYILGG